MNSSTSASRSKKVKVWVRTRPTNRFANDNIDLKNDGKVSFVSQTFYDLVNWVQGYGARLSKFELHLSIKS